MGRSLDRHLLEHHWVLKNGDIGTSALSEHVFSNHRVDLSKAMVVDIHSLTYTDALHAGESRHVQQQQVPLNRDRGTQLSGIPLILYYCY